MARRPNSDIRVSASDALEFEPEPKRRRRVPTTVWLLLVLILITGAGLGGFLFGDRLAGLGGDDGGQVPTVHAAAGPIKERPANPGGQEIPFRDYDINKRMQGEAPTGRVENLLPPPEQAKELPHAEAPAQPSAPPPTPSVAAGKDLAPPAEQAAAEPLLPAAPPPAPKPVAPQQVTSAAIAPAQTVAKAPTPQPAPAPTAAPTQPSGGPIALVPKSQQATATPPPPPAVPAEPVKTAPQPAAKAAPKVETATAAVTSGWQVQLAASRAASAANAEGERLKKKHSDVLGKLAVHVVRADLGAKGVFYRIRLGPAQSKDQARSICATLSKRGQGCLVIAPGK